MLKKIIFDPRPRRGGQGPRRGQKWAQMGQNGTNLTLELTDHRKGRIAAEG